MNPVAIRLLSQQLYLPQFDDPADVVSHFGAMQAQEYRLMRWAVAMRTRKPSAEAFRQAFDSGRIIRHHLLRGTWQLVSGEDYWWMRDLCAPRAEKVIGGWMAANHITLPEDEQQMVREILVRAVEEQRSVTKEGFSEALNLMGVKMTDQRLSYHIRFSELRGVLCSGDLLPMKATYSLTSQKIGPAPAPIDRDEALMRLARKYFQSHSPATLEDYVWWSSLSQSDCRKGMALLGDELIKENYGGREFYILASCRTRGFRKGSALLLPSYDEYLIGYKSRDIVLAPEHAPKAHNNSGNFSPVIAHNGIICGNWSPFSKELRCEFFDAEEPMLNELKCWNDYLRK